MSKETEIRKTERAIVPADYAKWSKDIISLIQRSKYQAALNVNAELLALYWKIGSDIIEKQEQSGWGTQVIAQLSKDLSKAFPDDKGYSDRNLRNMKRFAREYPHFPFWQVPLAKLKEEGLPSSYNKRMIFSLPFTTSPYFFKYFTRLARNFTLLTLHKI